MKKRLWLKIGIGVVAVVLAALVLVGNYLVNFAIVRKEQASDVAPESVVRAEDQAIIDANRQWIEQQKEQWTAAVKREDVQILSADGLKLKGDLFLGEEESHKWLLAIHGYGGKRQDMQNVGSFYGQKGYHVLTPDMRAHGESEGTYVGMGWLDREDVLLWIQYIVERDPEAQIILHGISMGGATVMMTAGEALPEQVKGIVEDCGYTSVWDIFSDELSYLFHLPAFPILYAADGVARVRAGYGFGEASSVEQLKRCQVPMLFIHGSEDNFVRTDMIYEVYDACPTEKEMLIIEGAGHGDAYRMDPDLYFDTVFDFIEEHCA